VADESVELLTKWFNGEEEALSAWLGDSSPPPPGASADRGLFLAEGELERATAAIVGLLAELRRLGQPPNFRAGSNADVGL